MVLQRDQVNRLWGWTQPGARVTLDIGGRRASGTADASGKWLVSFQPPRTGGPYDAVIDGPVKRILHDVLVGDVWLCGGQSNMEFGLANTKNGLEEAKTADYPRLRLFTVDKQVGYVPVPTISGDWKVCSPKSVLEGGWGGFSGVGYYFGKRLLKDVGVPIGLVADRWGGTTAEAWTSPKGLAGLPQFRSELDSIAAAARRDDPTFESYPDDWIYRHDIGSKGDLPYTKAEFDDSSWTATKVPDGFRDLGMDASYGIVWLRKAFQLSEGSAKLGGDLHLGPVYRVDRTFLNGVLVGESGWGPWDRHYTVPPGVLRPGKNVLSIRILKYEYAPKVFPWQGWGGIGLAGNDVDLTLGDRSHISLLGTWKGLVSYSFKDWHSLPRNMDFFPMAPSVLSNGMIAPLSALAVKGVIWYQGESNAERAEEYGQLLPAMVADWRREFGQPKLPFYIVSLANYRDRKTEPGDDDWAELREAQMKTAHKVGNSGLAVTIDVGDANDIHPKDKETVGNRLALLALKNLYGKRIVAEGPTLRSWHREGSRIRIDFQHTEGGLKVQGERLGEFSIAGTDRKWHWAEARIEGNSVVVFSPDIAVPEAVRYAWQANPLATLMNGAGLPAVPFRTDNWPGVTSGRKF